MPRFEILNNGLRVMLVPCEAESIAFGLFIGSGSRHETERTAGISHFIEHMLFKGTFTRTAIDITRAIEGRGGNFNAMTGEESTCYFVHMPNEYLNDAIDILSDMYLNAAIPDDEFAREKTVVLEEIKMYSDEPSSVVVENMQRALFPDSRLGAPVAGSAKSLNLMTPEDLHKYLKKHYSPTNTVAVLVGDFDEETAFHEINRRLGRVRRCGGTSRIDHPKAVPVKKIEIQKDVAQAQIAMGFRTPGVDSECRYALTVLNAILGRGMSSRLFQEVREKRGLSYDIISQHQFFSDCGMLSVTAGTGVDKVPLVLKVIEHELTKLSVKKVGAAELKRIKEYLLGNFRLGMEKVTSRLFFYGSTILTFGKPMSIQEQIDGIKAVSAEDIAKIAKLIFRADNRSLSLVLPKSQDGGMADTRDLKSLA